jgi:hypothetical protein
MKCPNCKLINPPTALRCDCGYDFEEKAVREPYLTPQEQAFIADRKERREISWGSFLFGMMFRIIGRLF